jgi:hypothetical protein
MTTTSGWPSSDDLSDDVLVAYLHNASEFSFFEKSASAKAAEVQADDLARPGQGKLMELWRLVLTDALRTLKRRDPREWKKEGVIDFDSFFNEGSLGVPELEKVVEAFAKFESLMYGASPDRYRDHVAHSFRVWIIGHRLLRGSLGGALATDAPLRGPGEALFVDTEEWECMWALTSLCHDIGYPLSMVEEINKLAKESLQQQGLRSVSDLRFSFSREMQPFYETIVELMSSKVVQTEDAPEEAGQPEGDRRRFFTHLQSKYYLKFLNALDQMDHGVTSALLTAKFLVYFLESDLSKDSRSPLKAEDARQSLIRREILRAIGSHSCPDIYHLRFNTLSFLLYIVDELQESGRPTLEEIQKGIQTPDEVTSRVLHFGEKEIDIEVGTSSSWEGSREGVRRRLTNMKRRLRLAVGTAEMKKDLRLRFAIKTKERDAELALKKGRIDCTPPLDSDEWGES